MGSKQWVQSSGFKAVSKLVKPVDTKIEREAPLADSGEQAMRERAIAHLESSPERFLSRYKERFGNVLNADDAATLFDEYNQNPAKYRVAVHPAAQWIRDELFRRALAQPAEAGRNRVVFTAGGNASGKSSTVAASGAEAGAQIVLDSTFGNAGHARRLFNDALKAGGSIMFEGAQGTMLDIDLGTYPFVTSSSATSGGAATGTGVPPTAINAVIGVTKAYCTRVGGGPFPSELLDKTGDRLRVRGNEYGAVTGRPRRCGWLDLPLLRYAGMINGISWLVVTKLDVLDELAEIHVCVGYKIDGRATDEIPAHASGYDNVECVYKTLTGWRSSTEGVTELEKLPKAAREYLNFIEKESGARIGMVSTGPGREQTVLVDEFAAELKSLTG